MTILEQAVATSQKLAPRSQKVYLGCVRMFVEFVGPHPETWTAYNLERWRDQLRVNGIKPKTVNLYMSAVCFASKRLNQLGQGPNFARGAERLREETHVAKEQKVLTLAQCRRLLATCDGDTPFDRRDRAIILIGLHAAFRREEIVTIHFSDCTQRDITVTAKGNWSHTVQIDEEPQQALSSWKAWLRRKGVTEGRVFRSLRRSIEPGWIIGDSLSGDGFFKILKARGERVRIPDLHPHTLRHTYATLAAQAGIPMWRIRKVMGHQPLITERYIHDLSEDATGAVFPRLV